MKTPISTFRWNLPFDKLRMTNLVLGIWYLEFGTYEFGA